MELRHGFYDFLNDLTHYVEHGSSAARMNARHEFLIADFAEEIIGAKVIDLAAHDGRWCYAFAGAGAAWVVGIEGGLSWSRSSLTIPMPACAQK